MIVLDTSAAAGFPAGSDDLAEDVRAAASSRRLMPWTLTAP